VEQNRQLSLIAAVWAAFLSFLFGANVVAIKISLAGLGAFTTAGIRFTIAAAAVAVWAAVTGRPFAVKRRHHGQLAAICVIFTIQLSLLYFGLSKTQAAHGALVANTQPFFVLLLAHFFISGDPMTRRKTFGILCGFGGVALVFLNRGGISSELKLGDLVILGAAFLWACNAVYTKRIIEHFLPFHLVLYPMIFAVPVFFLEGLAWDGVMIGRVDGRVVGALAYQSLVTASFGFVAWNSMLKKYGAVALHSFVFIIPVAGVLLGGLILDEPITVNILLAMGLIVTGILMVHFRQPRPTPVMPVGRSL
jgi:drug/metabolite transporter (DMT)-like permease